MIDPINLLLYTKTESASSTQQVRSKRDASDSRNSVATSISASIPTAKSSKDIVALSFELDGDLESLQESVSTVFEQVRSQLEKQYGLKSNGEDVPDNYFLPEDASAEEILAFASPESTASRIVSFAAGFYDTYLQNHSDRTEDENAGEFTSLVEEAIKKGFDEAEKILGGSFEDLGEIGKNIEKTYELVLDKIHKFHDHLLHPEEPSEQIADDTITEELKSNVKHVNLNA